MALGTHQRCETYPRQTRDGLNRDIIKPSSGTHLEKLAIATRRQTRNIKTDKPFPGGHDIISTPL